MMEKKSTGFIDQDKPGSNFETKQIIFHVVATIRRRNKIWKVIGVVRLLQRRFTRIELLR